MLAEMVGADRLGTLPILGDLHAADIADAEVGITDDACHGGFAASPGRLGPLWTLGKIKADRTPHF